MASARTSYGHGQGATAAYQAWNRPANGATAGQPRRCAWACARSRCVAGRPGRWLANSVSTQMATGETISPACSVAAMGSMMGVVTCREPHSA
jgi:hypothetical protein